MMRRVFLVTEIVSGMTMRITIKRCVVVVVQSGITKVLYPCGQLLVRSSSCCWLHDEQEHNTWNTHYSLIIPISYNNAKEYFVSTIVAAPSFPFVLGRINLSRSYSLQSNTCCCCHHHSKSTTTELDWRLAIIPKGKLIAMDDVWVRGESYSL